MKSLAEIARDFDAQKMARRMAHELERAGWREGITGLWSNGGEWMHLCDAHEAMTRGGG